MSEDMTSSVVETIRSIPPIMRYPSLLLLIKTLYAEVPNAKKEYDDAHRLIVENTLDFIAKWSE